MEPASQSQMWIRRGAVAAAALLVAVIAYILISGGDNNDSGKEVVGGDAAKIQELAADEGHPVYWAGPTGAQTFEWTSLPDGKVYVRYLTGGAQLQDPRPRFLTVGTYPVGNGVAAIKNAAKGPDYLTFNVKGGGIGLINKKGAQSVYLAYPGSKYQIEVFDPNPARARQLVTSGKIQPVP
jgi:hypothetical protein